MLDSNDYSHFAHLDRQAVISRHQYSFQKFVDFYCGGGGGSIDSAVHAAAPSYRLCVADFLAHGRG